mmetsp:Transcript_17088/g.64703  ORF Transcript_17088/g.64703 Transcript_17088/m.64703 type:complete len:256 (-) Transcript_17088:135-902(-)
MPAFCAEPRAPAQLAPKRGRQCAQLRRALAHAVPVQHRPRRARRLGRHWLAPPFRLSRAPLHSLHRQPPHPAPASLRPDRCRHLPRRRHPFLRNPPPQCPQGQMELPRSLLVRLHQILLATLASSAATSLSPPARPASPGLRRRTPPPFRPSTQSHQAAGASTWEWNRQGTRTLWSCHGHGGQSESHLFVPALRRCPQLRLQPAEARQTCLAWHARPVRLVCAPCGSPACHSQSLQCSRALHARAGALKTGGWQR